MKTLFIFTIIATLLTSCQSSDQTPVSNEVTENEISETDGILIHLTNDYDDPHRVLMPLKMANMMAGDKDVILYLDIDAVYLVLKDSDDLEYEGFEPLKTQLQSLIDKNIPIYACPTCLEIAGFSSEDLMDGVKIANKERFFDFTDGRIVTMNY
jgi:predicted peroxiredoxin